METLNIERKTKLSGFFEHNFGSTEGLRFFASPGRVNLIGEHIDYCGGYVFPAALTLDTVAAVKLNGTDSKVRLMATDLVGIYEFDLSHIDRAKDLKWGNYQAGVCKEFLDAGIALKGFDMVFDVTVPFGSGLSSSAAIELTTAKALNDLFDCGFDNVKLAVMSRHAENTFCGVNCGIMDQFASAMGKKDHAILLNCGTLEYEYIPLNLGENVIVIANTCKKHALGDSKYNERRREVETGLELMQKAQRAAGIESVYENLCDFSEEEFDLYGKTISDRIIYNRVKHVISENARVKKAVNVLKNGDIEKFGDIMRDAHDSISRLYEATGKELDAMFNAAKAFPGCIGARMTGGGFGGCTVNIVNRAKVDDFIRAVGEKYTEETGLVPAFYVCETGDGARELK